MTTTIQSLTVDRARAGLESAVARVKALGAGAWRFGLESGTPMRGRATTDEGWLLMRVPFGAGRSGTASELPESLWDLLKRNGNLSGGAKFVLDAADRVQVRAEIPLDCDEEDDDPARLIGEACRGFREAFSRGSASRGPADPVGGGSGPDLSALLAEAGWPHTARSNGDLAVPLDVPHGFYQALVRPNAQRGASFSVDVCPGLRLTPECREALAVLLLATCAIVRMVRAAASEEEGVPAVRVEVVLGDGLRPAQAGHALSALSVCCRLCGAECGLLARYQHLAEQFLAVRGWSSAGVRVDHPE